MPLTLVVLAAGMGSRYGGLKQVDPVGPSGETVLRASNGTGGGGVAIDGRGTWGDDDVADDGAGDGAGGDADDADARRAGGGVGVRTDARGRSA